MGIFLTLAFLFFIGSLSGWVLELVYRNLKHREKGWINPGFCAGPYVPLYGFGLCIFYLVASMENYRLIENPFWNKAVLFLAMAAMATVIEYLTGLLSVKVFNVRLWDYSDCWGNIQGIICPAFSLAWAALGAVYYFLIHPHILSALAWLSQNLAFSFFIGLFFGVFLIDVAHSAQLAVRLRKFAKDRDIEVKYEAIKAHIKERQRIRSEKYNFFRPFNSSVPLAEHLRELYESSEKYKRKRH